MGPRESVNQASNKGEGGTKLGTRFSKDGVGGGEVVEKEIEEVYRRWKYVGDTMPMKIKFRSQVELYNIVDKIWELARVYRF